MARFHQKFRIGIVCVGHDADIAERPCLTPRVTLLAAIGETPRVDF
jgi:hypothetical protein